MMTGVEHGVCDDNTGDRDVPMKAIMDVLCYTLWIALILCDAQAPELYVGPSYAHGTPADWFAMGVTLHEFVVGCR